MSSFDGTLLERSADDADIPVPLPIGFPLAEFHIERVIGRGGFGIVYLARDELLKRRVAIKEFMPDHLARRRSDYSVVVKSEKHRETFELGLQCFIKEAVTLAQFDHPSLVKVFRFWEDRGTAYMAMPYYEGLNLKQWLKAQPAPPAEAWMRRILTPLLAGLEQLHASHCLHRDIAPDNILLLPDGAPLLIDFGAARYVIADATQLLTVILKPGYAPIEQYAESSSMNQGPWTDIYALAGCFYFAMFGTPPTPAVIRVLHDDMPRARDIGSGLYSEGFLSFIDACLAVRPEHRPPDIAAVKALLQLDTDAPTIIKPRSGRGTGAGETTAIHDAHSVSPPPVDLDGTVFRPSPVPAQRVGPTAPPPVSKSLPVGGTESPSYSEQSSAPSRRAMWLWLPASGVAVFAIAASLWWTARPNAPPAVTTANAPPPSISTAPEPTPTSPPPAPARANAPPPSTAAAPVPTPTAPPLATTPVPRVAAAPSPASAQAVLSQIGAGANASLALKAAIVTERNGAARIKYQASEAGYAYVVGLRQDSNELVMPYPPRGNPGAKLGARGQIEVPLAGTTGVPEYFLLWARERRNLADHGWVLRDQGWARSMGAGVASITAPTVWGAPQCATQANRCDAAYAMAKVTAMTNVIPPATPPTQVPPSEVKAQTETGKQAAATRTQKTPSTEEKPPPARRNERSAQCRDLFGRASLGDTSPGLIEQMKSLNCGG